MKRRWARERIGWHVFARGARRLALFHDDSDFRQFLNILNQAMTKSGCLVWAYTMMSNHYHLVVYATSKELSRCMHHLNMMYSRYHNRKYGTKGHCFDGPYRAYKQWRKYLLFRRIAYVFLNPVAAGLVDRPEDYPWSNYRSFMGMGKNPLELDSSEVLGRLDSNIRLARVEFKRILEMEIERPKRASGDRLSVWEVQRDQFEWLLAHAKEKDWGQDLDPTIVAMHWARECGVFPRVMKDVLGETSIKTVKNRLYEFRKKLKSRPDLCRRLTL